MKNCLKCKYADWERNQKTPKPKHRLKLAEALNCEVYELFEPEVDGESLWDCAEDEEKSNFPPSPFAKYFGELKLGENAIDCYVLDNNDRVISLRATVTAITDVSGGDLEGYIGVKSLKGYIDSRLVLEQIVEFNIPGVKNLPKAKGITAESFLDICHAYVTAFSEGALATDRQREIAIRCSILLASCAKVGLITLIDEATGYQYERQENALQLKLKAFIADEMRGWEKTFPDELWEQFGRLTNWQGSLHSRPTPSVYVLAWQSATEAAPRLGLKPHGY